MTIQWVNTGDEGYPAAHRYIETGTGCDLGYGTIMLVLDGKKVLGAALLNNYQKQAGVLEIHAAASSARWLTRKSLAALFEFPFSEIGCQAVVMRSHPDNLRVSRIAEAYGFKRYEIPRLRGRDTSEIIFVLSDDDWASNGFHKEQSNG